MIGLFIEKYVWNCVGGSGRDPLECFSVNWQKLLRELAKNRRQSVFLPRLETCTSTLQLRARDKQKNVHLHITAQPETHRRTCTSTLQLRARDKQKNVHLHITAQSQRHTEERVCVFRCYVLKFLTGGYDILTWKKISKFYILLTSSLWFWFCIVVPGCLIFATFRKDL
jgi:hypothetical protein